MKIIASYCLLIALIGGFGLRPFFLREIPLANLHNSVCGAMEEKTQKGKTGYCHKQTNEEKKAQKATGCCPEKNEDDCHGKTDCTRTCCSTVTVFFQNNTVFEYPSTGIQTMFSTLVLTRLPNPFLGKITPPPNC